jgi:hypothetical protein
VVGGSPGNHRRKQILKDYILNVIEAPGALMINFDGWHPADRQSFSSQRAKD